MKLPLHPAKRSLFSSSLLLLASFALTLRAAESSKPNILFFFADDWGRYASIYADPEQPSLNDIIDTPNIDRIGREGLTFRNAFVPVASCNPCRASVTTGSYFWRCGSGAFLNRFGSDWEGVDDPFQSMPKFPDILGQSGYHTVKSGLYK